MATKSRGWLTIVYPESAAENWQEYFWYTGQQVVISPLHDKDKNPEPEGSEFKKPHYHCLLLWDGPTTQACALRVVEQIGGVGCLQCASIRGSVRYFCHLDNPDKYQYSQDDLVQYGGIDLDEVIHSDSEDMLILRQMYEYINSNSICYYSEFIDFCAKYREDWFKLVSMRYRENIYKYIKAYAYKKAMERGRMQ